MTVVQFPVRRPAKMDAGWRSRMGARARLLFGATLNRMRFPLGIVRPVIVDDALTGWKFEVCVRGTSVVISIDGREYAFDRMTGKFLGTGYAMLTESCKVTRAPL